MLNEPRLEKPTAKQTSVTDELAGAQEGLGRSIRRVIRYWCGVSPNAALKLRLKYAGDTAALRASAATSRSSA